MVVQNPVLKTAPSGKRLESAERLHKVPTNIRRSPTGIEAQCEWAITYIDSV